MTYVLIFISLLSTQGMAFSQEFSTEAACREAKRVIDARIEAGRYIVECIKKGGAS